jgi:hypothetical protein
MLGRATWDPAEDRVLPACGACLANGTFLCQPAMARVVGLGR